MGSKSRKTAKKPPSSKNSSSSKTLPKSKSSPPQKSSSKAKRSPPKPPIKAKKSTSKVVSKPSNLSNSKSVVKKAVNSAKTNHLVQQKKSAQHHHPISSKSGHPKQIGIKTVSASEMAQDKGKKRNYSEIDKDLLGLITESNHLFIQEIEEKLHLSVDDVKKALKRLEQKGKINTHNEMSEGKWKIEATIIDNFGLETQIKKKSPTPTITALIWETDDIPCYLCPNVKKCRAGQEELNPQKCAELSNWLEARLNKKDYVNPYRNQVKDIK